MKQILQLPVSIIPPVTIETRVKGRIYMSLSHSMHVWLSTYTIALFPGPAQLSVACSTEKQERAWYLFSCEWHQDRKDGRKGLIARGQGWPQCGNMPTHICVSKFSRSLEWLHYRALHALRLGLTCSYKQRKAGQGLRTRLHILLTIIHRLLPA